MSQVREAARLPMAKMSDGQLLNIARRSQLLGGPQGQKHSCALRYSLHMSHMHLFLWTQTLHSCTSQPEPRPATRAAAVPLAASPADVSSGLPGATRGAGPQTRAAPQPLSAVCVMRCTVWPATLLYCPNPLATPRLHPMHAPASAACQLLPPTQGMTPTPDATFKV